VAKKEPWSGLGSGRSHVPRHIIRNRKVLESIYYGSVIPSLSFISSHSNWNISSHWNIMNVINESNKRKVGFPLGSLP
jgi:hypothetical protein